MQGQRVQMYKWMLFQEGDKSNSFCKEQRYKQDYLPDNWEETICQEYRFVIQGENRL